MVERVDAPVVDFMVAFVDFRRVGCGEKKDFD